MPHKELILEDCIACVACFPAISAFSLLDAQLHRRRRAGRGHTEDRAAAQEEAGPYGEEEACEADAVKQLTLPRERRGMVAKRLFELIGRGEATAAVQRAS